MRWTAKRLLSLMTVLLAVSCHQPTPFVGNGGSGPEAVTGLYPISYPDQVCNITATQNPLYPACMLYLNFTGPLRLEVDATLQAQGITKGEAMGQHDRLLVADTGNNLRWFYKRNISLTTEMQDPQWSLDGHYIAFLLKYASGWAANVIRMSDKAELEIIKARSATPLMDAESDPSVWIGGSALDTAGVDAALGQTETALLADTADIRTYFGTRNVKLAYCYYKYSKYWLYYLDYRQNQATPDTIRLPKPAGRDNWRVENPIISADGKWVTYHMGQELKRGPFAVYIQRLARNSTPLLIADNGFFPSFWQSTGSKASLYIIYGESGMFDAQFIPDRYDLAAPGSLGYTWMQEIEIDENAPEFLKVIKRTSMRIAPYSMRGGLSKDGGFLATGYQYPYLFKVERTY